MVFSIPITADCGAEQFVALRADIHILVAVVPEAVFPERFVFMGVPALPNHDRYSAEQEFSARPCVVVSRVQAYDLGKETQPTSELTDDRRDEFMVVYVRRGDAYVGDDVRP